MTRRFTDLPWGDSFARLPDTFHQRIVPTPLERPRVVAFSPDVADLLDLRHDAASDPDFVAAINGERPIPGTTPVAAIYAGHQFGVWVQQLGDGRAILLGDVIGRGHQRWEVQVKGAGPTRFSRMGDGRAVLRSCIREFLGSEAMRGLGIPTTHALAIIGSDTPVFRETTERGALLVRIAPTHIRFGSFELFASRGMTAEVELLVDSVIEDHFPHLLPMPRPERHGAWFGEVTARTARLMAAWTATGFVHGVMNTDNMSILGLTLDYGPFAWMERYDRAMNPNHTDRNGRYVYDQQPQVGLWNCVRLAEALQGVVEEGALQVGLDGYQAHFEDELDRLMRARLGLATADAGDVALVADLLAVLHQHHADFTNFFRALSRFDGTELTLPGLNPAAIAGLAPWFARYTARVGALDAARTERMLKANPKFVLRNWMAQEAIVAAEAGDYGPIETLRLLLRSPFDEHPGMERFAGPAPAGFDEVEISCSS